MRRVTGARAPGVGDPVVLVRTVAAAIRAGAAADRAWSGQGVGMRDGAPRVDSLVGLGVSPAAAASVRAAGRLAARSGAPPATVLDALAASLEAQAELAARRRAVLAGPLASARLLALLPLTGPVLGAAVGADPLAVLIDCAAGTALLLTGLGLAALGRWWTVRLVRAAQEAGADQPSGPGRSGTRVGAGRDSRRARTVAAPPPDVQAEVEVGVLLELLAAASTAGSSVPESLDAVGRAAGGERGGALVRVSVLLGLGAGWAEAWSQAPLSLRPAAEALAPAWRDGAGPVGLLHARAGGVRREQYTAAEEAAGRLGVRLLIPLALCHLPAFVLVGLVPVLVSLARSTFGAPG